MAKATLPTNYKDDIMASSMAGKRRYNMIQNSDGTISLEDVTNYTQVGSNFGAAQMNQTNTAVNNSADKSRIIDSLADVAANTQAGMMAGALALRELNGKTAIVSEEYEVEIPADILRTTGWKNVSANKIAIPEGYTIVGIFPKTYTYKISAIQGIFYDVNDISFNFYLTETIPNNFYLGWRAVFKKL